MDVSAAAAEVLLHMLGLTEQHRQPRRNHYVTGEPDPGLVELIECGLIVERAPPALLPVGDRLFTATDAGRAVALEENTRRHPPPSPGKARYLAWLQISDVYPDLTFGEYLRRTSQRRRAS